MYKIKAKPKYNVVINDLKISATNDNWVYISKEKFDSSQHVNSVRHLLIIEDADKLEKPQDVNSSETNKQTQHVFIANYQEQTVPENVFVANYDDDVDAEVDVDSEVDVDDNTDELVKNSELKDDSDSDVKFDDTNTDKIEDEEDCDEEDCDEEDCDEEDCDEENCHESDLNKNDALDKQDTSDPELESEDEQKTRLESLREQAKELGIESYWLMKEKTLEERISQALQK